MSLDGPDTLHVTIRGAVLDWHGANARDVELRRTDDPWRLLVLEIASQQTQLARAVEGATAFCERFPTPSALATATPGEAIRAWAGLGYNRRAVALHRAAVAIVERHAGDVPASVGDLEALPGVGPYTARAVAAQAFGVPVGPVDVNVARLLGRLVPSLASSPRALQVFADELAAVREPGRWMHALIDFAAVVCSARSPRCVACPLRASCPSASAEPRSAGVERSSVPGVPFRATRRWLRGQLVRELRASPPGAWIRLAGERGEHGELAVREAIEHLDRDGLLERNEPGEIRLAEASRD